MSTYSIPAENLGGLQAKFAKLAKRAAKLGVPAPTLDLGQRTFTPERNDAGIETGREIEMIEVIVAGESPMYDGWHLTAVIELDHAEPDAPNVVGVVPGCGDEADVTAWRDLAERCDHCHVNSRRRSKLVVVTHEDGTQRIVGSTCLKDFLGSTSPDAIAAWAQVLADLDDVVEEFREGGSGEYRYDPIHFLGWVASAISQFGWVSRGTARFGDQTATADQAVLLIAAYRKQGLAGPIEAPSDEQVALAEASWEWAQTQGGNDYLNNVNAVAQKQSLRHNHLGIAASIVSAYQREQGKLAERKARTAATADSEFVGSVKDRIDISGEVVFVREFPGYAYDSPPKAMVKIISPEGNLFVWWASDASKAPEKGDHVEGKATVKDHTLYEGVKQTTITRAKLAVLVAA